jgi:hypothetical protein
LLAGAILRFLRTADETWNGRVKGWMVMISLLKERVSLDDERQGGLD